MLVDGWPWIYFGSTMMLIRELLLAQKSNVVKN